MRAIKLNRVRRTDAAELIMANCANRDYHAPWAAPCTDQAGFDAWFGGGVCGPNIGLLARDAASDRIVGVVNISQIVLGGFQSAYLGYYGMAEFARKGLMSEAMKMAIGFAFYDLGLHRLEANIQPGNTASIALVKKLSFKLEGLSPRYLKIDGAWRDHERWALLNDMQE